MALEISYSPQYFDHLEAILNFFDERNGSDKFSKKLLKMIHKQIGLLATMPEIGRITDFPGVRVLFVERFGIEYQIRDKVILIIDIYSCQTNPDDRMFVKQ
jgi:toxin YoeB